MTGSRWWGLWFGLLVGVAAVGGCGKSAPPAAASVRGTVSFEQHALAGGVVAFVPNRDRGTTGTVLVATVAEDGTFQLADGAKAVPAGWYRVAVADPPEWYGAEPTGTAFPAALRRPDLSGIECEVLAGKENVFDFPIEMTK